VWIQGISPFDDKAGIAEWHTSSVPISASPPEAAMFGSAGGTMIVRVIARSTRIAFHLMF
jgi:hypothetical protein